jgi:Winged helix-turn-helix domain (DUF2582)
MRSTTVAKKKTTSSNRSNSTPGSHRNSAAKKQPPKTRPTMAAASSEQGVLSNEQIGQVAGQIWRQLDEHGAQTLAAIKKSVDAPGDLVLAAVGWLAREDKLEFAASGKSRKISLRPPSETLAASGT